MPRMGKAGIRRSMAAGIPAAGELIMDWGQVETYLDSLEKRGCAGGTISAYRNSLNKFFLSLPEDKRIEPDSILNWRERLLGEGYTPRTVNSALSAVNSFLDYIGLRGYQLPQYIQLSEEPPQPELTRAEYLRLLSTARALNNERLYLMIKTVAVMGLTVQELPLMTVEAVQGEVFRHQTARQGWCGFRPACGRSWSGTYGAAGFAPALCLSPGAGNSSAVPQ